MKKIIFLITTFMMSFAFAKTTLSKTTTKNKTNPSKIAAAAAGTVKTAPAKKAPTNTKISVPDACVERAAQRVISYLESEDSATELYVIKNQAGQVTGIMDNTYVNADLDLESIKIKSKSIAHIIFSSPDYSATVMVKFDSLMPVCQILKVDSYLTGRDN